MATTQSSSKFLCWQNANIQIQIIGNLCKTPFVESLGKTA
jgi:hypothetical protein